MVRNRLAMVVVGLSCMGGCGAAQAMVNAPVQSQCESTGLKGCPELADGAVTFAMGDRISRR